MPRIVPVPSTEIDYVGDATVCGATVCVSSARMGWVICEPLLSTLAGAGIGPGHPFRICPISPHCQQTTYGGCLPLTDRPRAPLLQPPVLLDAGKVPLPPTLSEGLGALDIFSITRL